MKKSILCFFILLAISCGSDDDNSVNPNLLYDFTEPLLEFCINEDEFLNLVPTPDEINYNGTLFIFKDPQDGVIEIRYLIYQDDYEDFPIYDNVNVEIYFNQENFNFIFDWLTSVYGSHEILEIVPYYDTYFWDTGDYTVKLNVSNGFGDSHRIFVAYEKYCN